MFRAAIGKVVTVDRGHDDMLQPEAGYAFRDATRLVAIHGHGSAMMDRAESAVSCADVSEQHERCRAMAPTLTHVWAACLLAHGVEAKFFDETLRLKKVTPRWRPNLDPLGVASFNCHSIPLAKCDATGASLGLENPKTLQK